MSYLARIKRLELAVKKRLKRGVIATIGQLATWCVNKTAQLEPNLSPRLAKFLERAMNAEDDPLE